MKKNLLLSIGLALVVVIVVLVGCNHDSSVAPAEIEAINISSQQEGIWVGGQGKVTVTPDIATLRLGIEAQEVSVAQAQI